MAIVLSLDIINFKNLMTLIFIFAMFLIVLDIGRSLKSCPRQEVIYKYIPRTFNQEQNNPEYASTVFKDMFEKSSPWVNSFTGPTGNQDDNQDDDQDDNEEEQT